MKKLFTTAAVMLIFAAGAFAQLSGGVKAGLNLANLGGDDVEDAKIRPSIHIGGYVNYAFSETFSIQPELLYNSVGAKGTQETDFGDADITMKLNYISVPVMLVYSFGNFNVQAGPQIGFLAAAKTKIEFGGEDEEIDVKDDLKGTDFGLNIGLGAEFGKLNATARYSLGLTSIGDYDDSDIKNNVIQISIGYKLFGE